MGNHKEQAMKGKEVKLIDCTVRDGGLMNNWMFSIETVRKIYQANLAAGVDIMEMGYRVSPRVFKREDHGLWRFCDEEILRAVITEKPESMQIAVMADIGRCFKENFLPKKDSVIDIFRLACYAHQIDEAIDISNHLNDLGYMTFFNIMAVSTVESDVLEGCLKKVNATGAEGVYLADTFGSFTPSEVSSRLQEYHRLCPDLELGFHGHNNTQMAMANSLAAMEADIAYVDASYYGMGRGAGNTPLELLLPQLHQEKVNLAPVIKTIQTEIEPLMEVFKWGYRIPYAISGILNQHPKQAMEVVSSEEERCYGDFYEEARVKVV